MTAVLKLSLVLGVFLSGCSNPRTKEASTSETPTGDSTAPSGQEAAGGKKALVRVVEAIPGQGAIDLWFGDAKAFSNVAYKEVSPYLELSAERHEFKLQHAGSTEPTVLATEPDGLTAGGHYTVLVLTKPDGKAELRTITDDLSAPAAGKAKMRAINATSGLGKVDIVDSNGKIFGDLDADSETRYKEVAPSQGEIEVRKSDKKADALRVDLNLMPDHLYTLVLVGGGSHPLQAIPITDQLRPPAGQ